MHNIPPFLLTEVLVRSIRASEPHPAMEPEKHGLSVTLKRGGGNDWEMSLLVVMRIAGTKATA